MGHQILDRLDAEPAEGRQFRARNPVEFAERLRGLDHAIGIDSRSAST